MRSLLQTRANPLLHEHADAVVCAERSMPSPGRTARRSGYRQCDLATRVCMVDVHVRTLGARTYFADWLLDRCKRAESAMITVAADCRLTGVATRPEDKLVKQFGIHSLSKSQVSRMAAYLDEHVHQFRHRRLRDAGPPTLVAADALTMNFCEGGRVIKVRQGYLRQRRRASRRAGHAGRD
ncbi:transposase-like protein [Microbacterium thalassium]|uniref:Mutator family transposase n=1 Tax=Microbacterium thalassium TaxID=362649 RepID=A0A7X0FP19_9MICO|nr:transposase-like protein [Microbacterium thalassium]GLK23820.1 hypothetical protein GCM10017607_11380 [Microbacterium thalassium]